MNLRDKLKLMILTQAKKEKEPIWCEYLESDGNQWIDTKFKPNPTTTGMNIVLTMLSQEAGLQMVFGSRPSQSVTTGSCNIFYNVSNSGRFRFDWDGTGASGAPCTIGEKYRFNCLGARVAVNDNLYVGSIGKLDTYIDYSLYIFATNNAGSYATGGLQRVYSSQIYDNGVLVRSFRPCLHPETLRPAMYDTVNKIYYYNLGTGEFKYKLGFTKLDYVESTGTEYIDTNFHPNPATTELNLDYSILNFIKGYAGFLGARPTKLSGLTACNIMIQGEQRLLRLDWIGNYSKGVFIEKLGKRQNMVCFNNKVTIDGKLYTNGDEREDTYISENLYLFNMNKGNGELFEPQTSKQRIFACTIKDKGVLARDYIPARRNDGVICLYDFITGEYYQAKSSLVGGFVNLKGYLNGYQVGASIRAFVNQYIDTGINVNYKRTHTYTYINCDAKGIETVGLLGSRISYGKECTNVFCVAATYTYTLRLDILHPQIVTTDINKNRLVECIFNGEKTVIDGKTYTTAAKPNKNAPFTDYIFNINQNNKPGTTGFTGSCTNWLVITDNTPQLSLIPVKKDSFIGMLDTLTKKEYPNKGTGNFTFNE